METKVEAGAPQETAPREQFVQVAAQEIRAAAFLRRVTIQSFDWGALMRMRQVEPKLPLVALTNYDFLRTGQPGASPWLGGLDIDDFGDDPIRAIKTFGATTFPPVHGFPEGGSVVDPGCRPYVTAEMVRHAHRNGTKVVPWTVDDFPTLRKLVAAGVPYCRRTPWPRSGTHCRCRTCPLWSWTPASRRTECWWSATTARSTVRTAPTPRPPPR